MTQQQTLIIELSEPRPKAQLGSLGEAFSRDVVVLAYNCFGDLFLQDLESSQVAIAFLSPFELIPLDAYSIADVRQLLNDNPEVMDELLQPSKVEALAARFGKLEYEEIYIAYPIPALGGDGSIESYKKGPVWAHVEFVTA